MFYFRLQVDSRGGHPIIITSKDKQNVKIVVEFWARFCHGITLKDLIIKNPNAPILIHFKNILNLAGEIDQHPKRVARGSSAQSLAAAKMSAQSLANQFAEMMRPGGKNGTNVDPVPSSFNEQGESRYIYICIIMPTKSRHCIVQNVFLTSISIHAFKIVASWTLGSDYLRHAEKFGYYRKAEIRKK